jgi:subtilisin family serine protease
MYQKYLILTLLIVLVIPFPFHTTSALSNIQSNTFADQPLIEARLQMEIANAQDRGAPAILEFTNPLSDAQIQQAEAMGIQFARRGNTIINVGRIYSATVNSPSVLRQLSTIGLLRATSGSKQYVPSLTSSVPAIHADEVWNNLHVGGQIINGSGVTVAVIDTGAMWTHPSFWRQYPSEFNFLKSGSDYFIDLNNNTTPDSDEGPIRTVSGQSGSTIAYASDYMYIDVDGSPGFNYGAGDRWIGGIDSNDDHLIELDSEAAVILNISKISMFYDQFDSLVYVRGVNLTLAPAIGDTNGHGTHVSSTIAGGQPGFTSYVGVAPGADLIIIRSPLQSAQILDGISFAVENGADIINMSFSSYLGFLDGTDPEDLAVTEAFLTHGVISTAAAGNLGGHAKHARFSVSSGSYNMVGLDVSNEPDYSYLSLLWQSEDRDEHVILSRPSTDPIDLGKYSDIAGQSFALNTENLSAYVFCEISLRGMNNIIIQVSTSEQDWLDGHWTIRVENPAGDTIYVDGYAWDGDWGTSHMTFSDHTEDLHTISAPATADFAIAVASYAEGLGDITSTSSKGPRIDGSPKPDIAAPGVDITAASNSLSTLWVSKTGTSMASPHIAGALALICQAEGTSNAWRDYTALLNGAGGWSSHYAASSNYWGHGLCNAAISVMHVLNETLESGSTQSDWTLVDDFVTDPIDTGISGGLDILSMKIMQQVGSVAFAVTTASVSDFSGTNMLSIEWNSDSNLSTGFNGVDVLLNLTGNTLSTYEWSGSSFIPYSLIGSWWQDGTMSVLKVEGLEDVARGSFICATHNSTVVYVDQTNPVVLADKWRPLISELLMTSTESTLSVELRTEDRDSSIYMRIIGASVVDGSFNILQSSLVTGNDTIEFSVDSDKLLTLYINSLLFNVTSESELLFTPPVLLSGEAGGFMRFSSAFLDNSVIHVGLLFNEKISGKLELEGFMLASEVLIGFRYSSGLWLNFTLTGTNGIYEFLIAPAGFPAGEYLVYGIAKGTIISTLEMQFASLTIIEDNTIILVGAGIIISAFIVILIFRKQREKRL